MKGLKAAGNSCITSRTRKLSIEVELGHLAVAFRAHMAEALKWMRWTLRRSGRTSGLG